MIFILLDNSQWWAKRLNVIQTNLQVVDTNKINPKRLVQQIKDLQGDALIFNTGGIYAWYDTSIKYHYINDYLNPKYDLIGQMIEQCHTKGIKFIARFDFNMAHDYVFNDHPEWFVQDVHRSPIIPGAYRPGNWDLL